MRQHYCIFYSVYGYLFAPLCGKIAYDRAEMPVPCKNNKCVGVIVKCALINMVEHYKIGKIFFVVRGGILSLNNVRGYLAYLRYLAPQGWVRKICEKVNILKVVFFRYFSVPAPDIRSDPEIAVQ